MGIGPTLNVDAIMPINLLAGQSFVEIGGRG